MATSPTNLSVDDLAGKIKAKFPAYKDIDNQTLVQKVVAAHPEYGSSLSPEAASVAKLPNANAQAASQAANNTPLGANPTDLGDKIASAQATGALPPSNPQLDKLAPVVAGGGAAGLAEGAIAKVGLAGAGGAVGDAAQQLTSTGKINPIQSAEAGAGMAAGEGVGQALSPLAKYIGASKSAGAQMLQAAADKAGSAPVQLSPESDAILDKIVKQSKLGGTVPKAISDLLDRVGQFSKTDAPLTYEDARTLQSNISSLSANEKMALKGELRYLLPQFAKSFGADVQAGADAAGAGQLHRVGMMQYAQAAAKGKAVDTAKDLLTNQALKGAATAGGAAAAGGAGYALLRKFGVVH